MDVLAFIKSKKIFLKIQEGSGDNLQYEDIAAGYVDYVIWSTFKPEHLDIDQELEMQLIDGGLVYFKELVKGESAILACYENAFHHSPISDDDIIILITSEMLDTN